MRLVGERTEVGSLHVTGPSRETPALRGAMERVLGGADIQPPGLAPAAILIVRRLVDPMPGRLTEPRAAGLDREWERACREALEHMRVRATRPSLGSVSPEAEAVLFADEAELLACLASDVARGEAGGRWWWDVLAPRLPATTDVAAVLGSSPEAVPAVLSLLTRWGSAVDVVAAVGREEARALLRATLAAFGLSGVDPSAPESPGADQPSPLDAGGHASLVDGSRGGGSPGRAAGLPEPPPPGRTPALVVPVGARDLAPEQALLLAAAPILHERPALARSSGFRLALLAAGRRGLVGGGLEGAAARTGTAGRREAPAPRPPSDRARRGESASGVVGPGIAAHPQAGPCPTPARRPGPASGPAARPSRGDGSSASGHLSEAGSAEDVRDAYRPDRGAGRPRTDTAVRKPVLDDKALPGVPTAVAGALCLVNVIRRLDLDTCFEPGWPVAAETGQWGLVEALARGLLASGGRRPAGFVRDPLWGMLAALDGRDAMAPLGARCRRRHDYLLPPAWWPRVGRGLRSATVRGRTRMWGLRFVLADRTVARDALARGETDEFAAAGWGSPGHGPVAELDGPLIAPVGVCTRRWLALAVPFVRWWLGQSLDVPPSAVVPELFVRPGRVVITPMHVDVVMSLDVISLPVRRAGLDADPGWVPELGRVIRFRFE